MRHSQQMWPLQSHPCCMSCITVMIVVGWPSGCSTCCMALAAHNQHITHLFRPSSCVCASMDSVLLLSDDALFNTCTSATSVEEQVMLRQTSQATETMKYSLLSQPKICSATDVRAKLDKSKEDIYAPAKSKMSQYRTQVKA